MLGVNTKPSTLRVKGLGLRLWDWRLKVAQLVGTRTSKES